MLTIIINNITAIININNIGWHFSIVAQPPSTQQCLQLIPLSDLHISLL